MFVRVICMVVVVVVAAACSDGARITADEDGQTVHIGVGSELEVSLPGNPSTGYSWAVIANDPSVLEQLGEPAFDVESDIVGAGGTFIFRFRGAAAGTSMLKFAYERSFENTEPLDTVSVAVEVD